VLIDAGVAIRVRSLTLMVPIRLGRSPCFANALEATAKKTLQAGRKPLSSAMRQVAQGLDRLSVTMIEAGEETVVASMKPSNDWFDSVGAQNAKLCQNQIKEPWVSGRRFLLSRWPCSRMTIFP